MTKDVVFMTNVMTTVPIRCSECLGDCGNLYYIFDNKVLCRFCLEFNIDKEGE